MKLTILENILEYKDQDIYILFIKISSAPIITIRVK